MVIETWNSSTVLFRLSAVDVHPCYDDILHNLLIRTGIITAYQRRSDSLRGSFWATFSAVRGHFSCYIIASIVSTTIFESFMHMLSLLKEQDCVENEKNEKRKNFIFCTNDRIFLCHYWRWCLNKTTKMCAEVWPFDCCKPCVSTLNSGWVIKENLQVLHLSFRVWQTEAATGEPTADGNLASQ